MTVYHNDVPVAVFKGSSNEGRLEIGGQLLKLIRTTQGRPALGEWGTLVGVRPTKMFHKLWDIDENSDTPPAAEPSNPDEPGTVINGCDTAVQVLRKRFDVSEPKIELLKAVATLQRPFVAPHETADREVSVYGVFRLPNALHVLFVPVRTDSGLPAHSGVFGRFCKRCNAA